MNTETGRKAYECLGNRECSIRLIGDLWNKYIYNTLLSLKEAIGAAIKDIRGVFRLKKKMKQLKTE